MLIAFGQIGMCQILMLTKCVNYCSNKLAFAKGFNCIWVNWHLSDLNADKTHQLLSQILMFVTKKVLQTCQRQLAFPHLNAKCITNTMFF